MRKQRRYPVSISDVRIPPENFKLPENTGTKIPCPYLNTFTLTNRPTGIVIRDSAISLAFLRALSKTRNSKTLAVRVTIPRRYRKGVMDMVYNRVKHFFAEHKLSYVSRKNETYCWLILRSVQRRRSFKKSNISKTI